MSDDLIPEDPNKPKEGKTPNKNVGKDLSIDNSDIERVINQKEKIRRVVKEILKPDVDFTDLDGRVEKFLTKAGAEKLKMIFGLDIQIKEVNQIFDRDGNFAMFTHNADVYHLKTGLHLANCIGTCNSGEKKYRERKCFDDNGQYQGKEPTPITDIMNTLSKMSQKRAFVGAVILGVGASDYLTQDEDEVVELGTQVKKIPRKDHSDLMEEPDTKAADYVVKFGEHKGKKLSKIPVKTLVNYMNFLKNNNPQANGVMLEFINISRDYLRSINYAGK